jgi:hypothetical protein
MLPTRLSNVTIPRTGCDDVSFVALANGEPLLLETFFCHTMAARGRATFITALRPAMVQLIAEPDWWCEPGRPILICGVETRARGWIEQLVIRSGGRLKPIKGRPGFTVRIAKRKRRRLALLFIAMGAFVALMKEKGLFAGPNPLLIDGWDEMTAADQAKIRLASPVHHKSKFYRADIGRFFRFPFQVWIPVRTSDVRWFGRLRALVRQAAKYAAIELYLWIVGVTGCRPGEPQWITFGAWWESGKGFDRLLKLRNKGDDGEPEKDAFLIRELILMLELYVNGERLTLDPLRRDLDYWRRLGGLKDEGCEAARLELNQTHILLNSEGRRLTYTLVWYHVDTLFDRTKPNPASLHWLRHEFVFTRMREIERIKDPALRATKRDELCAYMGWATGELMLECYDAFNQKHAVRLAYISFGERREKKAMRETGKADNDDDEDLLTLAPMLGVIMAAAA